MKLPYILIFIALGVAILIGLVLFIKHIIFCKKVIREFKTCNVIVYGKKGRGKDLLFQWAINKRKDYYYANIDYSKIHDKKHRTILKSLKEVSTGDNDYKHIVENNITKTPHKFKEGKDIYISDIGVHLPSYMDSLLYKYYPSMPIHYALSRHLYNHNIHCNTQALERGWKALREQADFYIRCVRTTKIFGLIFITKVITYDKYESAKAGLLPIKTRLLNKYSKAQADLFNSQNGEIRTGHIINFRWQLHYDTRAFEKVLLKGKRKY